MNKKFCIHSISLIKLPFIVTPSSLFIPIKKTGSIKIILRNFFFYNSFYCFENFWSYRFSSWINSKWFSSESSKIFAIIVYIIVSIVSVENFKGSSFLTSSHSGHACPCWWRSFIALVQSSIGTVISLEKIVVSSEVKINISICV